MRRLSLLLIVALAASAQQKIAGPLPAPLQLESPVEDKNFWLFASLERSAEAREALRTSPDLAELRTKRIAALADAAKNCKAELGCIAQALRWTDAQIAEAGAALQASYRASAPLRAWVDGPLRQSGAYARGGSGAELLASAWREGARGINLMIDVYGLGMKPRYPDINSMVYEPESANWKRLVETLVGVLGEDEARLPLFWSPSFRFAVELMQMNHRDEAGRFEPMELAGHPNAAAFGRMKNVKWDAYPYTAILVPGSGNDRAGVDLSPFGRLRDEIAAKRYRDGKAPYIIVSGGFVHPNRTVVAEAIEMKKHLMSLGVPEEAIIADPHARHTTTNMRNAARLMFRYGFPMDRMALVTSDPNQSAYIENPLFEKRCLDELGYVPYKLFKRLSPYDQEWLPSVESLQIDPTDPLDP